MDFNFDDIKGWLGGLLVLVFGAGAGKALIVNWFQKSTELASARADSKTIEHQSERITELEGANRDLMQKLLDAAKIEGEQRGKIQALEGKIEQQMPNLDCRLTSCGKISTSSRQMVGRRKEDVQTKQ